MRRNRTEGRPVVYLDETWCNAHDGKDKAWLESDKTCRGGTIGGPVGSGNFELHVLLKYNMTCIASHLERGNVLLCCMQVAKMAGSLVSITCSEIANMSVSQVVIGYFIQRKGLQTIMKK